MPSRAHANNWPDKAHQSALLIDLQKYSETNQKLRGYSEPQEQNSSKWNKSLWSAGKDTFARCLTNTFCEIALRRSDFEVTPCLSVDELREAYSLLYKEYLARGYCQENSAQMHLNLFAVLPSTLTLVLRHKGKIVGTVSIINDSPLGLPMESLYPRETSVVRHPKRKIAEVGLLALDLNFFGRHRYSLSDFTKFSGLFHLFRGVLYHARREGTTDLLIVMHPKHQRLYSHLTFRAIGSVKSYSGACGNAALPMHMDVVRAFSSEFDGKKSLTTFFLNSKPHTKLKRFYHSRKTLQDLVWLRKDMFTELSAKQSAYLRRCFPHVVLPQKEKEDLVASG